MITVTDKIAEGCKDCRKETIMNLLNWLSEQNYLNVTLLEYDYDEQSYIDVGALSPEDVYAEYMDWLENKIIKE